MKSRYFFETPEQRPLSNA